MNPHSNRTRQKRIIAIVSTGVALLASISIACGTEAGAETPPEKTPTVAPSPTPTEKPTHQPTEEPAEAPQTFDEFVAELEAALKRGDLDYIFDRIPSGDMQHGGWRSEGSLITAEKAAELIEWFATHGDPGATDDFGAGDVVVYAINDGAAKAVILTGIVDLPPWYGTGSMRASMALFFEPAGETFELKSITSAYVLGEDFLSADSEAKGLFPDWERYVSR